MNTQQAGEREARGGGRDASSGHKYTVLPETHQCWDVITSLAEDTATPLVFDFPWVKD